MRRIPERVRDRIFEQWIRGDSYRKIGRDNNVSISTVHVIKEEFKKKWPDIEELRRLNILVKKSNISFYDSLRGATLLEKLNSCGVSLDDLDKFVKLVETLLLEENGREEEIIEAAIKLIDLEEKTEKSYPEVIKDFQKKNSKIPKLETKINHLKEEEKAEKARLSKLKRSVEALQNQNQRLLNQKKHLLNDIAALKNVRSALRKGILQIPCKHCGRSYIKLRVPTKEDYLRMVRNGKGRVAECPNCRKKNIFLPQEIAAEIAWVLLPEEVVVSTST